MYDIIVVGGGASGLIAAISACRTNPRLSVAILERNARVGKKLLTTGNGRCNVSNSDLSSSNFNSNHIELVERVVKDTSDCVQDFFVSIGIPFVSENGQLYPYSLQAASVLDALRYECERLNIDVICDCFATQIKQGFTVSTNQGEFKAKKVIVACGGNAMPKSGSDGNGLKLLSSLGLKSSKTFPAIVPIKTELPPIKPLKGVKIDAKFTLTNGLQSLSQRGEVLFAEYGISGPAVMFISRFVNEMQGDIKAVVDFLPDMTFDAVVDYLNSRKEVAYNYISENLTLGLLHKRVGQAIIKYCELNVNDDPRLYSNKQIYNIANAIKNFTVKVNSTCGFEVAQTTAGGIYLNQINTDTFETKNVSGLYLCGEMLDCDGVCGGYNLHWAWVSGMVAGRSAARGE